MGTRFWSMASLGGDQEIRLILDVDDLAASSRLGRAARDAGDGPLVR